MVATATENLLALMPFARLLGIEQVTASSQSVTARVPWDESRCTSFGVLHGGVLMSLADSIGAYCAVLNLPQGAATSTIESKTNFLRAVRSGHVVIDTELYDDQERLVGRVTQTQAVLAPRT
jgi:1,4-dihydroxy-2-naphthoyl-CoA hydrolase